MQGALFFPIIIETFGAIGPRGLEFLSKLSDEAISNGVGTLEDQRIKSFIIRFLSFIHYSLIS